MIVRTLIRLVLLSNVTLFWGCLRQPVRATVPVAHGILSFRAHPRLIHAGEKTTIRWQTAGIADVYIDQDPPPRNIFSQEIPGLIENLPAQGELIMQPEVTTTYVLEWKGSDRISYASARVKVIDSAKR